MKTTWEDRVIEERKELYNKMVALNEVLHDEDTKVPVNQLRLLEVQYSCMEGYLKVLNLRLKA